MKSRLPRVPATMIVFMGFLVASCTLAAAQATVSESFKSFVSSAWSVETIVSPAASAAGSQLIFKPAGFGTGAAGYGYHFGVSLGDNVGGKFMRKFVFPALTGKLDVYTPEHGNKVSRRLLNVAGHTLFFNPLQPSRTFNWSGAPAALASAALANAYQPDAQKTGAATFQRFGTNTAGYAFGDLLNEFSPELCRNRVLGSVVFRTLWKCK